MQALLFDTTKFTREELDAMDAKERYDLAVELQMLDQTARVMSVDEFANLVNDNDNETLNDLCYFSWLYFY